MTDSPVLTISPPLTLYIHIPWCVRKCPYCDFNSHTLKTAPAQQRLLEKRYIDAVVADLQQELGSAPPPRIETIFIGGGTPSLFSPEAIEQLLATIATRVRIAENAEITLEANPGTLEQGKFAEFRAAGINRLSIGIQSFSDEKLQALGRVHDRRQAMRAAEQAHAAGFDSFNLDLMFGLPAQTPQQAMADLHNAMDLEPSHLSWYQLTIEPNTLFYTSPPVLPTDETLWQIQQQGQELMGQRGYDQYEISAYAQQGQRCRHNLNYWQFGDYLGIGAGAHGKRTLLADQQVSRRWKPRHPQEYMEKAINEQCLASSSMLSQQDLVTEFMMNALRLTQGFADTLFTAHTGLALELLHEPIERAQQKELLGYESGHLQPTPLGHRFLNDLISLFLE